MANATNEIVLNRYSVQITHIKILDGKVCTSTEIVETAADISDEQQAILSRSYADGCVKLFVMASEKTIVNPTPSFVVEGLYGKVKGGSDYSLVASVSTFTVNANGVYPIRQLTVSLGGYTSLKLYTSAGAWAGGDSIKVNAWLICEFMREK